MRQIANSFIPFTLLLLGIVVGVLYSEKMAAEKSRAYDRKEIKPDDFSTQQFVVNNPEDIP